MQISCTRVLLSILNVEPAVEKKSCSVQPPAQPALHSVPVTSGDGNSCPKLATLSALQVAEKWMKIEKQVKIPTWKTAGVRYSRKLKTQLKILNLEGRWNAFTLIGGGRLIWKFKWNEWILWKLTRIMIMIYRRSSDLEVNDLPNTSSCQGGGTLVQDQTEWNGVTVTIFVVLISQNCLFVSSSSVKASSSVKMG